jgi:hypothetical protein
MLGSHMIFNCARLHGPLEHQNGGIRIIAYAHSECVTNSRMNCARNRWQKTVNSGGGSCFDALACDSPNITAQKVPTRLSPKTFHRVVVESSISADDGNLFDYRLRNDEPVKWVTMMKR